MTPQFQSLYTRLIQMGEIYTVEIGPYGPRADYSSRAQVALLLRWAQDVDMLSDVNASFEEPGGLMTMDEMMTDFVLDDVPALFVIGQLKSHCAEYRKLLELNESEDKELRRDYDADEYIAHRERAREAQGAQQ